MCCLPYRSQRHSASPTSLACVRTGLSSAGQISARRGRAVVAHDTHDTATGSRPRPRGSRIGHPVRRACERERPVARLRPMSDRAAYFIGDAHLGADAPEREAEREQRLHDFLGSLPGRASALYVIGDLFDFWFEYRTAVPARPFRTLAALRALVGAGVPVTYLNG